MRLEIFKREGTGGRRHIISFNVVLQKDGDPVQGTGQAVLLHTRVEPVCLLERVWVYKDDRIEVRSLFVIRFNAGEIAFDQPAAGEPAVEHCLVDGGDGRFLQHERTVVRCASFLHICSLLFWKGVYVSLDLVVAVPKHVAQNFDIVLANLRSRLMRQLVFSGDAA